MAAAHIYGTRASGTMAHSFVEAFEDKSVAFAAFTRASALLMDTCDTEQGVHKAVEVLRGVEPTREIGVRLNSGVIQFWAVWSARVNASMS